MMNKVIIAIALLMMIGCSKEEAQLIEVITLCSSVYIVSNQACQDRYENGSNASAACGALETNRFVPLSDLLKSRHYHDVRNNRISIGNYSYDIIKEDCQ